MENSPNTQEELTRKATVAVPIDKYQLISAYASFKQIKIADAITELACAAVSNIDFNKLFEGAKGKAA